jgi:hypothetical protein
MTERETRQIPEHHTPQGTWCRFSGMDSFSGTCQMCAPLVTIVRMWDRKTETVRIFASDELAEAGIAAYARERAELPAGLSDAVAISAWLAAITNNDEGIDILHEPVAGSTATP